MKPNFAFTLSYKGIGLLHRAFPGWRTVGEVGFDASDLPAALEQLRQTALAIDPDGVRSKLVIPNDQIKFLDVSKDDTKGESDADALVRERLAGATPYDVDDLAYDWVVKGDRILIAAVARETLAEAENFACEHNFEPVCFVAIPEAGTFEGEPFFGKTALADTLLSKDDQIARDMAAISIIETASIAHPKMPDAATGDESAYNGADTQTSASATPVTIPDPEPAPDPVADADPAPAPEPLAAFSSIRARRGNGAHDLPDAAPRLDGVDKSATSGPKSSDLTAGSIPISTGDDLAPPPATATPILARFFRSKAPATPPTTPEPPLSIDDLASDFPDLATDAATDTHIADLPDTELAAADWAETADPAPKPKSSFFSRRKSAPKPKALSPTASLAARLAGGVAATATTAGNAFPSPTSEAQRMTVFGARQDDDIGGKPRHLGLILTVVLLAFLAGVAAWATLFLDDGIAGLFGPRSSDTEFAATDTTTSPPVDGTDLTNELAIEGDEATVPEAPALSAPQTAPQTATIPAITPPATPPVTPPVTPQETDTGTTELASLQPGDTVTPQPPTLTPPQLLPTQIPPEQAIADYAATGIWQTAPVQPQVPASRGLERLYITSIDRDVLTSDAVALSPMGSALSDHQPQIQLAPVAPEVRFAYDARGLVIATRDGALTPDGITVFTGRPSTTPPQRPSEFAEDPAIAAQITRLASVRPHLRPGNLVEQNERSTLGGRTRIEMSRLRPTARPTVDPAKLAEEADETATEQAIASSPKPHIRPSNFAAIVERAQEQQETVTNVAAVAPRTVTPAIPSGASVARLATAKNAINLRRINLIGVYGKPSSRRALVRLANGRYRKVEVGDRLDGGRISAIGESELRYVKGGRNVVLTMPRG